MVRQETYTIIRYYAPKFNKPNKVIKKGLTLAEAQAHCSNPTTQKENVYFDGYVKGRG